MCARMTVLEYEGLKTINLFNCWLGRRPVLLVTRAHWMYEYTDLSDYSRTIQEHWATDHYAATLKKIKDAPLTDLHEGLTPFRPNIRLATMVSSSSIFIPPFCSHI